MKITIKDVAHQAGVSIATVSRALNNTGVVHDETRQKIVSAAKDLQYTPNASARSLSRRKTDTIGLLLPDIHGEFYSEVIRGADCTAQQFHHHLLVSSSHNKKSEIEAALKVMRGRVDGLIIMSPHIDAHTLDANLPRSLPVVLLNCFVEGESFDSLNIDNFAGAYQMVKHLISHGHRRIAIIKGPEKNYDADLRLQGYRHAMMEVDRAAYDTVEIDGEFTEESGYAAVKKILSVVPRPTAVFACSDYMAIGALSALHEAGIEVPNEIALAGFDNIPIANFTEPALTTVNVAISNLGVRAITCLIDAVREKNNHKRQQVILPTTLVIRESCGCNIS